MLILCWKEKVNEMPWMTQDIDRLIELVEDFCTPEQCKQDCPFWISGNSPCLKDVAYSLRIDYNSIRDIAIKFIKGIECYVTNDF